MSKNIELNVQELKAEDNSNLIDTYKRKWKSKNKKCKNNRWYSIIWKRRRSKFIKDSNDIYNSQLDFYTKNLKINESIEKEKNKDSDTLHNIFGFNFTLKEVDKIKLLLNQTDNNINGGWNFEITENFDNNDKIITYKHNIFSNNMKKAIQNYKIYYPY